MKERCALGVKFFNPCCFGNSRFETGNWTNAKTSEKMVDSSRIGLSCPFARIRLADDEYRMVGFFVCRSSKRKKAQLVVLAALGSVLCCYNLGWEATSLRSLKKHRSSSFAKDASDVGVDIPLQKDEEVVHPLNVSNKVWQPTNQTVQSPQAGSTADNTSKQHRHGDNRSSSPLTAILHIGPRKTGTTSIQYGLHTPAAVERLAADGFEYLGKWPGRGNHWVQDMLLTFADERTEIRHGTVRNGSQEWKNFVNIVEAHRNRRESIIISSEAFPWVLEKPELLTVWRDVLRGFDVKVVVTYRRPFEWLLSEHYQELKYSVARGWDVPDLVVWLRDRLAGRTIVERGVLVDAAVVDRWRRVFSNVYVFNFHTTPSSSMDDDLLQRFCCQALMPEAPATCAGAQHHEFVDNRTGTTPRRNRSAKDRTDFMALALRMRQTNNTSTPLVNTAQLIKSSYQQMSSIRRFPTHCMSDSELQDLLALSLQVEKDLVPEWFESPFGEAAHRKAFQNEVERKTFCSVSINKTFANEELLKFLMQVTNRRKRT